MTEGVQDGSSALVRLRCHTVSWKGILLPKFYRWFQMQQQIIKGKAEFTLLGKVYTSQVLTWVVGCQLQRTWDIHKGRLGGAERQRKRCYNSGLNTEGQSSNAWGRSPGISQSVGVNQCGFFPSKWGHILSPFWGPLGTPVVIAITC